jgi:hypothetical protein
MVSIHDATIERASRRGWYYGFEESTDNIIGLLPQRISSRSPASKGTSRPNRRGRVRAEQEAVAEL